MYHLADAGVGGRLVDSCIEESKHLECYVAIIGKESAAGNKNADAACNLFEKLYKDGFKKNLYREAIQSNFKTILPAKSIEKLNEGAKMSNCMESIAVYVEHKSSLHLT